MLKTHSNALKMSKRTALDANSPQAMLHRALQQPLLLAPPPTPTKQKETTAIATMLQPLQSSLRVEDLNDPNSPHFPDHLGCGEVFTWHCEGEFYAVECRLCDDHPLCPLSEFPLHMEAWHTDWTGKLTIDGEDMDEEEDEEEQNDLYHVLALSPQNNEDSGLCDYDHDDDESGVGGQHLSPASQQMCEEEEEDVLEPFEQVLIEQENNIDTTQVNENDNQAVNERAADAGVGISVNEVKAAGAEEEREVMTEGDENTLTTTVLIASAETTISSNNVCAGETPPTAQTQEQQQQQQLWNNKSKQYHNTILSAELKSPLKEENPQEANTLQQRENESLTVIRESLYNELCFSENSLSCCHSTAEQLQPSSQPPQQQHAQLTQATVKELTSDHDETTKVPKNCCWPEESYDSNKKQEIQQFPKPMEAGEIIAPQSQHPKDFIKPKTKQQSKDHIQLATNSAKKKSVVEITKVEILNVNNSLMANNNSAEAEMLAPNVKDNSPMPPRKRKRANGKCLSQEINIQPQKSNPPLRGKYLKSFKKFLQKSDTESLSGSEIVENDSSSPNSSPLHCASMEPKRRRLYSRACKKSPTNSLSSETNEYPSTSPSPPPTDCDSHTFLSPAHALEPEVPASPQSDKSSKIRYLVKQCERIAREHSSSAASTISSSSTCCSSNSSLNRGKRNSRRRRSLTPVEVCDIQPTVPLNDHILPIYDDSGNMSPEMLSEHLESLACSLLDYDDFPDDDHSVASTSLTGENILESSPSSPGSPKTEEEHFEFHEPREKLNKMHVLKLIELYQEHTRLWDQTHREFCEPHLCRQSWQDIAERWNAFCNRKFHITEVRIRISTLCQRYLKERERIQREGELDESAKFPYYEQMSFLEQHRSLQKRREVYEQQNEKILEIYQKHLVLWHVRCYKVRQVKERTKAFQSISSELKDIGIYLSSSGVQKRIRSLRKCYRLEKIRHLHAQVERMKFEPTFKHYERMQFLDKHIDPFVCRVCGKIFESLVSFKEHLESSSHGNILEEEDEDEEEPNKPANTSSNVTQDTIVCGTNEKFEISMNVKDLNSVSVFIKPLAMEQQSAVGCNKSSRRDASFNQFPMEDVIMEELIENVSQEDEEFAPKTLDTYLHSCDSPEDVTMFIDTASNSDNILEFPLQSDDVASVKSSNTTSTRREDLPKLDGRKRTNKIRTYAADEEYHSGDGDTQSTRLSDDEIHKMISIYKRYRQLWDPNHLDYNTRSLRRQAWFALTTEFNKTIHRNFSWRSLYRKLIDYAKYYKKLTAEQNPNEIKWIFYKDLTFLDDVIAVSNELGRSIHQRSTTLKLIEIYRDLPQLWNIRDPDFNKRPVKQRNINIMCNRLQEETNKDMNPERIKNRIIELRTQYRGEKKKRLRCLNNKQKFFPEFEYYEEFSFIDAHIDPFECDICGMDFKRLTDFNNHLRKEHEPKRRRFRNDNGEETANGQNLDNVCHICGVKFSNRGNLGHHLIRHEGVRNFECSMCPKKFFTSHSLKVHVRTHTKECPYICEKCGLSFVNASKLNQHVLRHTDKKNFKCDHCPKAFFTAFERDRHTRWHLNIRDKDCPICGKSFVKGSSYYAHLMLHSDTKRFKCDKCDMKFAQYAGLYKHKKRYHST
ncbi:uncharacterized protein LOC106085775 [Stomoxys calcitrans]|uniref:uncharacterized protein LOC106085775 n=1 Tax=Stomoxys calcitrans TaxID=35570 RepID=UPI0027E22E23|nr:uncharacterized protein LOC106085775 [Stomoxys calcitrans]XP_059222637.1 uncharacterized protein LOC106085775 [Stomoxys calcitrans]XP_059222638.1 uncharacterized protein LOC106085775 [Stomoxys calcitrans]